jgi:hypothetical protein
MILIFEIHVKTALASYTTHDLKITLYTLRLVSKTLNVAATEWIRDMVQYAYMYGRRCIATGKNYVESGLFARAIGMTPLQTMQIDNTHHHHNHNDELSVMHLFQQRTQCR